MWLSASKKLMVATLYGRIAQPTLHTITVCMSLSHRLCLAVVLHIMLCGRILPCMQSVCYSQQSGIFNAHSSALL